MKDASCGRCSHNLGGRSYVVRSFECSMYDVKNKLSSLRQAGHRYDQRNCLLPFSPMKEPLCPGFSARLLCRHHGNLSRWQALDQQTMRLGLVARPLEFRIRTKRGLHIACWHYASGIMAQRQVSCCHMA